MALFLKLRIMSEDVGFVTPILEIDSCFIGFLTIIKLCKLIALGFYILLRKCRYQIDY